MGPGKQWDGRTGLYYFDRFGNLELLYEDPEISCQYPLPLVARSVPREVPTRLDPNLAEQDEAEVVLTDVYQSVLPMPTDRKIESLRVFQLLPKGPGFKSNNPRVGYPNAATYADVLGKRAGGKRRIGLLPSSRQKAALLPSGRRQRTCGPVDAERSLLSAWRAA